jgi:hypothetical protein
MLLIQQSTLNHAKDIAYPCYAVREVNRRDAWTTFGVCAFAMYIYWQAYITATEWPSEKTKKEIVFHRLLGASCLFSKRVSSRQFQFHKIT